MGGLDIQNPNQDWGTTVDDHEASQATKQEHELPDPQQLAAVEMPNLSQSAAAMQTIEVPESVLMADPMHVPVDPSGVYTFVPQVQVDIFIIVTILHVCWFGVVFQSIALW